MTITEFLLARIAEDEVAAQAALAGAERGYGWASVDYYSAEAEGHGRRFGPERVLAECQAKRAIIDVYQPRHHVNPDDCYYSCHAARLGVDTSDPYALAVDEPGDCTCGYDGTTPALRHLAAVYADHPDYDPELRP